MARKPGEIRRAMTLLELVIATTMMTTVVLSVSVLVRTGYTAWLAQEADLADVEAAHAVVRHILRKARQAESVVSISLPSEGAGSLSLLTSSGQTVAWARNGGTDEVLYGVGSASDLLGEGITELRFTAYKADGVTTTTDVDEIQAIKCSATVTTPTGTRTATAWAWLRAW
ncbi:MAG: hypothetical protein IIA67_07435 [Planctomycetes bacterium]|nr:hypothetical protein [Planctomycetota bacterium]